MSDWPFTRLGLTFFEGTLPKLVRALERIADALEKGEREKGPYATGWKTWTWALTRAATLARDNGELRDKSVDEIVAMVCEELLGPTGAKHG